VAQITLIWSGLKPNSITLAGSELVRSQILLRYLIRTSFEPAPNQLQTSFEPAANHIA